MLGGGGVCVCVDEVNVAYLEFGWSVVSPYGFCSFLIATVSAITYRGALYTYVHAYLFNDWFDWLTVGSQQF